MVKRIMGFKLILVSVLLLPLTGCFADKNIAGLFMSDKYISEPCTSDYPDYHNQFELAAGYTPCAEAETVVDNRAVISYERIAAAAVGPALDMVSEVDLPVEETHHIMYATLPLALFGLILSRRRRSTPVPAQEGMELTNDEFSTLILAQGALNTFINSVKKRFDGKWK